MADILLYLALGVSLGVVTSVPIGVANAAVVDTALRSGPRRALALAAGAASADFAHACLAFVGLGPLLADHPPWPAIFFVISGVAIATYGVVVFRAAPKSSKPAGGTMSSAYLVGLLLTISNPGALMAWMVVAAAVAPADTSVAGGLATGVGIGAFAWFSVLALLAGRGRNLVSRHRSLVSRIIGAALIALGLLSLLRGIHTLWR